MVDDENIALDISGSEEVVGCTISETDENVECSISEENENINIDDVSVDDEIINCSMSEGYENINIGVTDVVTVTGNGDKNFVYEQQSASSTWDITHNLNKLPSITVIDSAGSVIQGEYEEVDENRVILYFSAPFTGKAIMN